MSSEIGATLAFGFLTGLVLFAGRRMGFFQFSSLPWNVPIRFVHLIGAFAIYFLVATFSTKGASLLMKKQMMLNYLGIASWLNFGISLIIAISLGIYLKFLPHPLRSGIFHRPSDHHSFSDDVWNALYAWVLAFPLVLFLSKALELIITQVFHITQLPDQIAVKFLKSTFDDPIYFTLAVISIIIFAPLIEETLFRGFLQTYIRKHLGSKQAILITSVCFALFHYAAGQGLGNIPIVTALFFLALFLGFLYEKQGSLFAPMALHGAFNAISVLNLYFFGGFTTGI